MRLIDACTASPRQRTRSRCSRCGTPRRCPGRTFLVSLARRTDEREACPTPGMFTYEVRLGHWPDPIGFTAQGRFGPPLRIAGRSTPAAAAGLPGRARPRRGPGARAIRDAGAGRGRHVRPRWPKTRLWAVLYARVEQADATAWRNLMLLRAPLFPLGDPQFVQASDTSPPLLYGEGRFRASPGAAVTAAPRAGRRRSAHGAGRRIPDRAGDRRSARKKPRPRAHAARFATGACARRVLDRPGRR